jgi:hypothetical protein
MALLLAFFHHSSRGCDGCYGFAGEKVGDHPAKLRLAFGVAVAFPSPHRKARKGIAKNVEKILKIQLIGPSLSRTCSFIVIVRPHADSRKHSAGTADDD